MELDGTDTTVMSGISRRAAFSTYSCAHLDMGNARI